jgi:hypothetical protein
MLQPGAVPPVVPAVDDSLSCSGGTNTGERFRAHTCLTVPVLSCFLKHSPTNIVCPPALPPQVVEFLEEVMPPETPLAFGLHPNAEIGFKLRETESFCAALVTLQPREAGGEGGMSTEEKAKMVLDDLADRLPERFDMEEVSSSAGVWWDQGVWMPVQENEKPFRAEPALLVAALFGSLGRWGALVQECSARQDGGIGLLLQGAQGVCRV